MDDTLDDREVAVIKAPSEFIVGSRLAFRDYVLRAAKHRHVFINLAYCPFIDSSAIGMLLHLSRHFHTFGKNVGVFGMEEHLRTLLENMGVDREVFVAKRRNAETVRGLREFTPASPRSEPSSFPPLRLI